MRKAIVFLLAACLLLTAAEAEDVNWNANTPTQEVISDPVFGEWGRLLFPADEGYWSGTTLGSLRLTWYGPTVPETTVEIVETLKSRTESGERVF